MTDIILEKVKFNIEVKVLTKNLTCFTLVKGGLCQSNAFKIYNMNILDY